jgi:aldehyde dehydrogenase (NAD+)
MQLNGCFFRYQLYKSHRSLFSLRMAHTTTITIATTNKQISVPTGLFINNEFVPSVEGSPEKILYVSHSILLRCHVQAKFRAINPSTEEVICSVVSGNAAR